MKCFLKRNKFERIHSVIAIKLQLSRRCHAGPRKALKINALELFPILLFLSMGSQFLTRACSENRPAYIPFINHSHILSRCYFKTTNNLSLYTNINKMCHKSPHICRLLLVNKANECIKHRILLPQN